MKKIYALAFFSLVSTSILNAQKKEVEKTYIKKMCGCYTVDFEYAETFSEAKDYQYHERYKTGGLEWIFVDEENEDKVVLQHLLVINDSMIIKHWRQDWLYENREILVYEKNLEWRKEEIPSDEIEGTWTQKVYQVDDSPRYDGYAHWLNVDGKTYWESQVFAPLPRREYTKRSDYNVMLRNNKHKITEYGHLHELDNAKIIRTEEKDSVLVLEKGHNTYRKVEDSHCQAAKDWWLKNRRYWVDVRAVWEEIISEEKFINIQWKVDDKKLWQELFALGDSYTDAQKYKSKKVQKEVRKIIENFLTNTRSDWKTTASTNQKSNY